MLCAFCFVITETDSSGEDTKPIKKYKSHELNTFNMVRHQLELRIKLLKTMSRKSQNKVELFYLSMAQVIKRLPKSEQTQLKDDFSALVVSAQLRTAKTRKIGSVHSLKTSYPGTSIYTSSEHEEISVKSDEVMLKSHGNIDKSNESISKSDKVEDACNVNAFKLNKNLQNHCNREGKSNQSNNEFIDSIKSNIARHSDTDESIESVSKVKEICNLKTLK